MGRRVGRIVVEGRRGRGPREATTPPSSPPSSPRLAQTEADVLSLIAANGAAVGAGAGVAGLFLLWTFWAFVSASGLLSGERGGAGEGGRGCSARPSPLARCSRCVWRRSVRLAGVGCAPAAAAAARRRRGAGGRVRPQGRLSDGACVWHEAPRRAMAHV